MTLATYEKTLEVRSVYGVKKTLVSEEIIMNSLEELKAENYAVRERLNKQDEMFKTQAGTNTKIEGVFHAILLRLSTPFLKP